MTIDAMRKKKSISKEFIINRFMDYVLLNGHFPPTIYSFAKENNFDENLFYEFYGSFKGVEKEIFKTFFARTMEVLEHSEDYKQYDPRTKLLSFYYTLFENLTANRSYVLNVLKREKGKPFAMEALNGMKPHFKKYIESLNIEKIHLQSQKLSKFQDRTITESAWLQLLLTIKFWMDDESPSFEKTDIFIEKSINTSFDVLDVVPLKSVIDFGKFIWNEKVRF